MLPTENSNLQGESLKVLQMIEQGQISAEEGIRLLNMAPLPETALAAAEAPTPAVEAARPETAPLKGWLRVRVTDTNTNRNKVTVNLPLGLMAAGMKIGAHFAPELESLDAAELVDELKKAGSMGKIVDVLDEEDGEHMEIFIE